MKFGQFWPTPYYTPIENFELLEMAQKQKKEEFITQKLLAEHPEQEKVRLVWNLSKWIYKT